GSHASKAALFAPIAQPPWRERAPPSKYSSTRRLRSAWKEPRAANRTRCNSVGMYLQEVIQLDGSTGRIATASHGRVTWHRREPSSSSQGGRASAFGWRKRKN